MTDGVQVEGGPLGLFLRPRNPTPTVVLYVHGTRDFSGDPGSSAGPAGSLAVRSAGTVLCARYRPVFPAALDDVEAAYHVVRASGPVVVVGERVGAALAAALLVRLRDKGAAPPAGAVLLSGLLDLTLQARSLLLNAGTDPLFDLADLRRQVTRYAAGTAPTDPTLSPLFANLHGLPAVQLLTAGTDPLLDDSLAFGARAARSGVTVDLRVRPDAEDLRAEALPAMTAFIDAYSRSGAGGRSGGSGTNSRSGGPGTADATVRPAGSGRSTTHSRVSATTVGGP